MTNFDFLKTESEFASFADMAVAAENVLDLDFDSYVINCRWTMGLL